MPRAGTAAIAIAAVALTACPGPVRRNGADRPPRPLPVPVVRLPAPAPALKLTPELAAKLEGADASSFMEVIVDLTEQVDLEALRRRFVRSDLGRLERREETVRALERVASRRAALEARLEEGITDGSVDVWRGYAIVNRLYVSATPGTIRALSLRDDIARLATVRDSRDAQPGAAPMRRPPARQKLAAPPPAPERSWALDLIGAREAWEAGWDGRGIVVGSLDTGVAADHVSLRGNFRGADGWLDPLRGGREPYDDHGHGTETLACAVGRGAHPGEVGVAPGAIWIAARSNPRNYYNSHAMTAAADWMLRTGGAEVLVCAWGHEPGRCDRIDVPILKALRAAEVVVALPAGNSGPADGTGESPANLPPLFEGDTPPLSVAAVTDSGELMPQSSRGPSACAPEAQFPWIAAPGAGLRVPVALDADGYAAADGTSLSAGYVAGVAAVLLQRCPSMTVDTLQRTLAATARDLGPAGPDTGSGYGLVNLAGALRLLERGCP